MRSEIIYTDDDGNLVDQSTATSAELIEYDANGDVIRRTYLVSSSQP